MRSIIAVFAITLIGAFVSGPNGPPPRTKFATPKQCFAGPPKATVFGPNAQQEAGGKDNVLLLWFCEAPTPEARQLQTQLVQAIRWEAASCKLQLPTEIDVGESRSEHHPPGYDRSYAPADKGQELAKGQLVLQVVTRVAGKTKWIIGKHGEPVPKLITYLTPATPHQVMAVEGDIDAFFANYDEALFRHQEGKPQKSHWLQPLLMLVALMTGLMLAREFFESIGRSFWRTPAKRT